MSDYRFEQQLATTAQAMAIRSLAKAHTEARLQLRPAFQRNLVWNKEQKSYLVDSILRNMPIPEVYIQIGDMAGRNEELMVVVDGQQRISTCIEFFLDKLRLTGKLAPDWAGRTYSELSEDLQSRFSKYRLIVRELPDLDDDAIREIFSRLNRVVEPLRPQELRHAAYSGDYIKMVESIAAHPVLQQLGVFSARDFRRRGNDELIAEIMYAHMQHAFPNKKEGLDEVFQHYGMRGLSENARDDAIRRVGRVFGFLQWQSSAIRNTRFRNKSDFYSLAVYLLERAESIPESTNYGDETIARSLQSLSSRIEKFRKAGSEGQDIETTSIEDALALKYMRAVERAASDRLSRVRRDQVLNEWLGSALASSPVSPLRESDETWLTQIDNADEESAIELKKEREHLAEVLLRASPVTSD